MIKVLKAGFHTSIQDSGRKGYASMGIPHAGVMDKYAAMVANYCLGNSLDAAVIEMFYGMSKLQFIAPTAICISGADFTPKINGTNVELNSTIHVNTDDVLSFGQRHSGARIYIAVKGGILSKVVLGSRSQYENITNSKSLSTGDIIKINELKAYEHKNAKIKFNSHHLNNNSLTVYQGPEFHLLNTAQQKILFETSFSISNNNNRMAYQLNELVENEFKSMLTSAVMPGTVQLTPSGKLIVLMRDCQVTGGYPRVLQLSDESIDQLSQKSTGEEINFRLV